MKNLLRYGFFASLVALCIGASALHAQVPVIGTLGPDGGIVNVVRGTANDSIVLIGVRNAGIFSSLNGGASWIPTSLRGVTVNDIVFHPSSVNKVYAATSAGLYVSGDGGFTWTLSLLTTPVSALAINPQNPSMIFAADGRPSGQSNGVFRTLDGGATPWTQIVNGFTLGQSVTSLVIDPASSPSAVTLYAGTDNAGVYTTGDGGNTWNVFANNLGLGGPMLRIHSLTVTRISGAVILEAGTSFGPCFSLGGSPWYSFPNGIADNVAYSSALFFGPGQTLTYYVGTKGNEETLPPLPVRGGLYSIASNGGSLSGSWNALFSATLDVNSIFVPSTNAKKIYCATSDGIYVSADGGQSWARHNLGLMAVFAPAVAVMAGNSNYLFASVFGGGIQKSTNGGGSWNPVKTGMDNPYTLAVAADSKIGGVVYAANVTGIYKSTDTANTWQKLGISNIPHDSASIYSSNLNRAAIRVSPINPLNIFAIALTGEFIRSIDGGMTWTSIAPPQPRIIMAELVENIECDPVDASTLYYSANGLWKSTDLGNTWISLTGDLPASVTVGSGSYQLLGIHPRIDPNSVNVIYLPTVADKTQYGIYKTVNGGVNWSFLGRRAFDVSIDKTSPSTLFCSGTDGIFHSEDGGSSWTKLVGDGSIEYYSITPDPQNVNVVFVASNTGITRAEFGAYSSLELPQTSFDFGIQPIGSTSAKNVSFKNAGQKRLTVRFLDFSGSADFSLSPPLLNVDPGSAGTITVQFVPKVVGAGQAQLFFSTNDPKNSIVTISVHGSGVAPVPVSRTVLLETTHGLSPTLKAASVAQYLSQFVQALQQSGITVRQDQAAFDPFAATYNAVVIAPPRSQYLDVEVAKIRDYVVGGGFVVILGDSGSSGSPGKSNLNSLLSNFQWVTDPPNIPTGLRLNDDVLYDSTANYLGMLTSPILKSFVDPTHPFAKGVTSVIPFGGSSISVSQGAISFLNGSASTIAVTNDSLKRVTRQPSFAAISQIGKGRILLIGDVDIWSNSLGDSSSSSLTGILAGKNLQFALNVFGYVESYAVKLPKPTPSEKYQIVSIPYDLSSFSIRDVLKDLGPVDKTKWRLYGKWTGTNYLEFPSPDFLSFRRGEGYWLITKGECNLTLGTAKISTQQDFYAMKLDSGYNLIGNPFPYRVSWANSLRPTPDSVESWLWNFTGSGFQQEANVMEPFTGYFIKSLRNGVTIYINPEEIPSGGSLGKTADAARQFGAGEWEVKIRATNGVATDQDNIAGVLKTANDAWDAEDFSEPPPAPTDYLALSFSHRDWKENPGRYAGDFRAVHPDGNYWDFDIASAKPEASVTVTFTTVGTLPSGFEMVLVDLATERVNDIRATQSYNFTMKKDEPVRQFRLVIGTKAFVEKNTDGIPLIPVAYSLAQNFPNPFNPSTTIQYSLGHSAHVELEIYDLLGQKLKSLFAGDQRIGVYSISWDGTNDRGTKLSSGVYFYRIKTEEFTSTRKMVLLK